MLPNDPALGSGSAASDAAINPMADPAGNDAVEFHVKTEPQELGEPSEPIGLRRTIHLAEGSHQHYHEVMEGFFTSMRHQMDVSTSSQVVVAPKPLGGIV